MGLCIAYEPWYKPTEERVIEVFRHSSAGKLWTKLVEPNEEVFITLNVDKGRYTWYVTIRGRSKYNLNSSNTINGHIWLDVGEYVTLRFNWTYIGWDLNKILNMLQKVTIINEYPLPKPEPLP